MIGTSISTEERKEKALSQYELERNKPMPSFNHSLVQARISSYLLVNYEDKFTSLPEISLQLPKVEAAVLDIAIYPKLENN